MMAMCPKAAYLFIPSVQKNSICHGTGRSNNRSQTFKSAKGKIINGPIDHGSVSNIEF
jgi:hypothetical protein